MDDLTSHEEEKNKELAREMGRQEEQRVQKERDLAAEKGRKEEMDRQKERDTAAEKGRKQELEAERARAKKTGGGGLKIALFVILLLIILAVVAYLTLGVSVTNATPGNPMPFTTNYGVSFPEGQVITIGNSHITVLSYQNELITDIDGDKEKLVVGEPRVISSKRAVITTFSSVTLMDTFFEIDLTYKGERDNRAYFDMAVHTSKQVPDIFLRNLLPAEIDARPI